MSVSVWLMVEPERSQESTDSEGSGEDCGGSETSKRRESMKGNNELILNEATMIEAVQFWLDSRMTPLAPKVMGIKLKSDGYVKTFEVALDADADR
jgi:hypothetical protein